MTDTMTYRKALAEGRVHAASVGDGGAVYLKLLMPAGETNQSIARYHDENAFCALMDAASVDAFNGMMAERRKGVAAYLASRKVH